MTKALRKCFAVRFKELNRWSVGSFREIGWRWPAEYIRPLSDALIRKLFDVEKKSVDPKSLKLMTLHFDGEMELRHQDRNKPIKGRLWWANPGDVIYSKIDVRHGAIGIVPPELGRVCVTSEFPVYKVDSAFFDAQYIKLLFRTTSFQNKVNSMISGASGRKLVQPADLESIQVPLPPLIVQKTIVSAWEQAKVEVADIQRRISELGVQIEIDFLASLGLSKPEQIDLPNVFSLKWSDLNRWSIEYIKRNLSEAKAERHKYPLHLLCDLCNGQSGSTPSKRNKNFWNGKIPWVSPKDMKADWITGTINHISDDALDSVGISIIPQGSVLVVVRSGILQHKVPIAVNMVEVTINQDIRAFTPKPDAPISADFLAIYLRCMQHKLLSQVKWSTTVQSINKESIETIEIPLPPLDMQKRLVEKVYSQRKIIAQLKAEADQKKQHAKADVEAMILGIKPVPDAN
ncbi:MAG: restriction endonuclease subunit S [Desulfobacterales bacterium]